MNARFRERLINSGLVGPERTAALQHEGHAFEGKMSLCGTWTFMTVSPFQISGPWRQHHRV
jgi:hypothetical protein